MTSDAFGLVKFFSPIAQKALGPKAFRKLRRLRKRLSSVHKFDEVYAVYRALGHDRAGNGFMIDVGGHRGESFDAFAVCGWRVDCFEPNPANHPIIRERILDGTSKVTLYPFAVSDAPKQGPAFYLSDQSTGISSLHAFHETHREGFKVDVIALRDHLAVLGNPKVDFLKVDAEGFDFFVLQGIDWDACAPEVIVCEFDDRKTRDLGYSYKDMAQYLLDRGYEVIVSEWHPILAYGQTHSWNRFTRYPSELATPDAWGNLVALRPGFGAEAVLSQLEKFGPVE